MKRKKSHKEKLEITPVSADAASSALAAIKADSSLSSFLSDLSTADLVPTVVPATSDVKSAYARRLNDMDAADKIRRERDGLKNELESYCLSGKRRVRESEEDFVSAGVVKSAEDIESLANEMSEVEDWLYEDEAEAASVDTFKEKLSTLKKKVEGLYLRLEETEKRPKAVEQARSLVSEGREMIANMSATRPWVKEEMKTSAIEAIDKAEKWLDEKEKEQEGRGNDVDAAFLSTDVFAEFRPVQKAIARILQVKKPKEKKPKPSTKKEEGEREEGEEKEKQKEGETEAEKEGEREAETEEAATSEEEEDGKDEL